MPAPTSEFQRTSRGRGPAHDKWDDECEVAFGNWRFDASGKVTKRECFTTKRVAATEPSAPEGYPWESLPSALSDIRDAIVRSREMLNFPEDWDEDGAKPIDKEAWNRAVRFLIEHAASAWKSEARVLDSPDITPCPDGSVDLHWDFPRYEMLINFPVDPAQRAGFYGDDRGTLFIKGTFDPATLNQGLLDWLSKTR